MAQTQAQVAKRNECPLVLKQLLDRSDNASPTNEVTLKGKGKGKKSQYIDLNQELEDKSDDDGKGKDEYATINCPVE